VVSTRGQGERSSYEHAEGSVMATLDDIASLLRENNQLLRQVLLKGSTESNNLDAAYLASLSKADYDALMKPRMKGDKQ
jgi:hypothetical protein